ncbi:MAG: hypothetical protein WC900_01220 [Oscillospiraceae bacterium]|jgi:hypothetical protein
MFLLDDDHFHEQLRKCEKMYVTEYQILLAIQQLMDGEPIEDAYITPSVINHITKVSHDPLVYDLHILPLGVVRVCRLSDLFRHIDDGRPANFKRGYCHRGSFAVISYCGGKRRIISSEVSMLADKNTYLHSWVEVEDNGLAFDYTLNACLPIADYRIFVKAQESMMTVNRNEFISGKLSYHTWFRMIESLYE